MVLLVFFSYWWLAPDFHHQRPSFYYPNNLSRVGQLPFSLFCLSLASLAVWGSLKLCEDSWSISLLSKLMSR